jgi:hypothetical protein
LSTEGGSTLVNVNDADGEPRDGRTHGTLGRAFWRALDERLREDPRLQEVAKSERLGRALAEETPKLCRDVAHSILGTLLERMPAMLEDHREVRDEFAQTIRAVWGEALDLLETFIVIASEAGDDLNRRHWDAAAHDADHKFHALIRVHARACLVANEILALLRAGYASGAHARWRTLHELASVAYFLSEHGQDVAERYLEHDVIQAYKGALLHRRYADALAEEQLADEEFASLKAERGQLVSKYGTNFKNDYGWSAEALGSDGKSFAAIEMAVGLDHLRPYYRMASNAVHPNIRGSFFDLGVRQDEHILLVGPSPNGLADPGAGACRSLLQTTVCLHGHRLDIDELVVMLIAQELEPQVVEAFARGHHTQESAESRDPN